MSVSSQIRTASRIILMIIQTIATMPNQSPEPTAIVAVSAFENIMVCIDFNTRWLSFFR